MTSVRFYMQNPIITCGEEFDASLEQVIVLLRFDAVNSSDGMAAKELLQHINLKCLAARAIIKHKIPYEG